MARTTRALAKKKRKAPAKSEAATSQYVPSAADKEDIISTLYTLVSKTSQNSTICPSQIPRALHASEPSRYSDWRSMMQPVREIVWEEVKKRRVEVTQGGVVRPWEDREGLKGPIRVRRGVKWDESDKDQGGDDAEGEWWV